jgi:hypothetical protein
MTGGWRLEVSGHDRVDVDARRAVDLWPRSAALEAIEETRRSTGIKQLKGAVLQWTLDFLKNRNC